MVLLCRVKILLISGLLSVGLAVAEGPPPLVQDQYRLSKDREAFEELRKQIPAEKRAQNDELAAILEWMGEVRLHPSEVRERFNALIRKKSEKFNRDLNEERRKFVENERKRRAEFDKKMKEKREDLNSQRMDREQRRTAFEEMDAERRDFNAAQKEARDTFEESVRDRRKNFEDYVREKTAEFNSEHRAYSKRYEEWQKRMKEKKSSAGRIESSGQPSKTIQLGTEETGP
ncbi:MAG: hypothetical protein N2578_04435 [Bdellovibrionaceae bacterium]|nr:hypothetical protein [Pseudobdellovibrionaceae bacterium]